jgi:hypothetical protein
VSRYSWESNQNIESLFYIVGIFIDLHWCKEPRFPNFLIKNWLDDPTTGFQDMIGLANLNGFGEAEEETLDIIYSKFPHEV